MFHVKRYDFPVIPAPPGIRYCTPLPLVIPAGAFAFWLRPPKKAGIQSWTPAFAGVTVGSLA